ncbi:MAG: diaminopimelate epimerase [Clostridiales bacterium]|jgi:carbamoyl-phosphate synthase large subunit|nr:diaminopimelate epimerase [Clostridiales bacterium]
MEWSFTKMQGAGNDYIYFNCFERPFPSPEKNCVILAHRHLGVGGDGIVLIQPSDKADAYMRMFNADGSEGRMCGNAIRCVAKYLYDNNIARKTEMTIETLSGVKTLYLSVGADGQVSSARVDMGRAELSPGRVPIKLQGRAVIARTIHVGDNDYDITCVSMGNPHAVVFMDNVADLSLSELGPLFERHPLFPEGVNTEFIRVINKRSLEMRVWERGTGETQACGTGACAAAVAAVINGFSHKKEDITVKLLGGELIINYTDDAVFMTGGCVKVFEGVINLDES